MNVTLVQFSHGILALSNDVSVHVTHTQDEVDPHPDNLYNPATGFAPNEDAQLRANIGAEAAAAADEAHRLQAEATAKAADEAAKAEADAAEAAKAEADAAEADAAEAAKATAKTKK